MMESASESESESELARQEPLACAVGDGVVGVAAAEVVAGVVAVEKLVAVAATQLIEVIGECRHDSRATTHALTQARRLRARTYEAVATTKRPSELGGAVMWGGAVDHAPSSRASKCARERLSGCG